MKINGLVTALSLAGLILTAGTASAESYGEKSEGGYAKPGYTEGGSGHASSLNLSNNNSSKSSSNAQGNLNQAGSLVNTQINNHALGRGVVGQGIADCTSSGIAFSAYGSGYGPFESGSIGGTFTYTHSFGMGTCKAYAKTQLGRARLETCLLLISNYAQMTKAGLIVDYEKLQSVANVDGCPAVTFTAAVPAEQSTLPATPPEPAPNIGGAALVPPPIRGLW